MITIWCSFCSAEPAISVIDVEIDGEWHDLDVGEKCLTRMEASGRMEE